MLRTLTLATGARPMDVGADALSDVLFSFVPFSSNRPDAKWIMKVSALVVSSHGHLPVRKTLVLVGDDLVQECCRT